METETRKQDELVSMLEHLAGVLTRLTDRVTGLEDLSVKNVAALVAQQQNVKQLAAMVVDAGETQGAIEAMLREHKLALEQIQAVIKGAAAGPAGPPPRTVN